MQTKKCMINAKWETIKASCTEISKEHSKQITGKKRELLKNLYKLNYMQHEIPSDKSKGNELPQVDAIYQIETKIKELEEERLHASRFRSRVLWH